ncbi:hypothetical protein [Palleronia sp. THAF1]|uniref:hypothetical protein n=1 Tax=Palleronia sp. THAF1 TaxID=2587842 RepID=UPI0011CE5964|nr:hypothetical protein [Palleronia sp. THAF1]
MNDDDLIAGLRGLKSDASGDLMERVLADAALEAGRRDHPKPSELLMARVMRDARTTAGARRRRDIAAWGSLAAACVMGLAVGLGDPGGYIAGATFGSDFTDVAGGYGFQYAELSE